MQKNVREIAVLMQDKEKEYKICEKLRRQPELSDLKNSLPGAVTIL